MKNYMKNVANLIVFTAVVISTKTVVFAETDCEENYGGNETCLVNKRFRIEKYVRKEGEDKDKPCKEWDKETTVDLTNHDNEDRYLEFCIRVKNLSDDEGDINFDDMKVKDSLPEELHRIGGDGLTEYWDDFEPGETKEFKIKVKIDEDELDRKGEYEKCAVNKAQVYWDGEFEGSDTATVCWKNYDKKIKELPKTGAESALAGVAGLTMVLAGAIIKKIKGTI